MNHVIPTESLIYKSLEEAVINAKIIVLCGLPGVGKSLYSLALNEIATKQDRSLDIIQWDLARKQFETEAILTKFPLGDGLVHNGVKLAVGDWLMSYISTWIKNNQQNSQRLLLIEAPLIGHRFIELARVQKDTELEFYLSSQKTQFLCPIPSKEVRQKIRIAREAQVNDNATNWIGAKPKVMQALWEHLFNIAGILGFELRDLDQTEYDPLIYDHTYKQVLKNRNYFALKANEVFKVPIKDETELHQLDNIVPTKEQAARSCALINRLYPTSSAMDQLLDRWYMT